MNRTVKSCPPIVTYQIYSRCIIIKELSNSLSEKKVHDVFHNIMNSIVKPVMEKYNLEMFSYAIEGNKFYIIITTFMDEKRISSIIQHIKSRFAEHYNRTMNRRGPFRIGEAVYDIID